MPCKLPIERPCECVGPNFSIRMFCPYWAEPERPRGALDEQSDTLWAGVSVSDRRRCLDHLRQKVGAHAAQEWAQTYARGNSIGSNQPMFHFRVGMAVRNCLREVLPDDKLPGAKAGLHWDDYYMGALNEFAREVLGEPSKPSSSARDDGFARKFWRRLFGRP